MKRIRFTFGKIKAIFNNIFKVLYEILDLPDPKYKYKFLKPVTYFMRSPNFEDSETKVENHNKIKNDIIQKFLNSTFFIPTRQMMK